MKGITQSKEVTTAGERLQKAFDDAREAVERDMRKRFGDEFILNLTSALRQEVDRLPLNVEGQVRKLIEERIQDTINTRLDAAIRQMWGSFIQGEVQNALQSPNVLLEIAKKLKGLV